MPVAFVWHRQFWKNIVQEPLEWLAMEFLTQCQTLTDVTIIPLTDVWTLVVKVLLVIICSIKMVILILW